MLTNNNRNLLIFEAFTPDESLPKRRNDAFRREVEGLIRGSIRADDLDEQGEEEPATPYRTGRISRQPSFTRNGLVTMMANPRGVATTFEGGDPSTAPFWSRWIRRLLSAVLRRLGLVVMPTALPSGDVRPEEGKSKVSAVDFFSQVHDGMLEIDPALKNNADAWRTAIKRAHEAGQEALVERLFACADQARSEAQLVSLGQRRYWTEEQIVRFARESSRAVRLDWLRDFLRPIPEEVVATKKQCDERMVFDAYAVLHYDPKGGNHAERPRDPILVGLVEGVRRLYFVGDWVDDQCDLTMAALEGQGIVAQVVPQVFTFPGG